MKLGHEDASLTQGQQIGTNVLHVPVEPRLLSPGWTLDVLLQAPEEAHGPPGPGALPPEWTQATGKKMETGKDRWPADLALPSAPPMSSVYTYSTKILVNMVFTLLFYCGEIYVAQTLPF